MTSGPYSITIPTGQSDLQERLLVKGGYRSLSFGHLFQALKQGHTEQLEDLYDELQQKLDESKRALALLLPAKAYLVSSHSLFDDVENLLEGYGQVLDFLDEYLEDQIEEASSDALKTLEKLQRKLPHLFSLSSARN